jgi:B-box zinc finger
MIRCSMCNSMTYKELKKLPVNYALLEAFESQTKKKMCKDHNSEIMGYCNLDDALLCGTCMFNHRNHDVYLLTDPKITDIATSKKNAIKKQESGLIEVKEVWDKANAELESGLNELQISIEKHKKALASTEEKIIMKIKMGTNHCIEEISKLAESDECSKIGKKIKENLTKIKARLDRIVEIKHKYDALPIEERLKKPIENEIVVLEPPPSLAPVVKIMEKLKGAIDYELCIKKHNLSIS